jgi:SAM-dependent MidA family methyltransferase
MDRFEAGLRPLPDSAPLLVESEPRLVERIRAEIGAKGPITFAQFMALALYEPDLGYYCSADERPGRAGDFLTAPETHPIFGAAIARQLDEVHRRLGAPERFVVREHGAGSGALALAILAAINGQGRLGSVAGSPALARAIRYVPIEVNDRRRVELTDRLGAAGFGGWLEPGLALDASEPGATLANELLDALPVHRVTAQDGRVRELFVDWQAGAFVEVEGEPSTPALGSRLADEGIVLGEGARAEICLELDGWFAGVARSLARGVVLVVDYGHPAAELYGPTRGGGTLRAYAGHRVHDDWTIAVGRQDLTAHVDFSAVDRTPAAARLDRLGQTSQAEFLVGLGLDELLEAIRSDPGTTVEAWLATRSAVRRLLDPRATGGFRVAMFGRGIDAEPSLAGLGYRLTR